MEERREGRMKRRKIGDGEKACNWSILIFTTIDYNFHIYHFTVKFKPMNYFANTKVECTHKNFQIYDHHAHVHTTTCVGTLTHVVVIFDYFLELPQLHNISTWNPRHLPYIASLEISSVQATFFSVTAISPSMIRVGGSEALMISTA